MEPQLVARELGDFARRITALDPLHDGPRHDPAEVEFLIAGTETVVLTASAARALCAALRSYHDPRDRGRCAQCGGPRLDDGLRCLDCGQPGGLFGQLVRERAARHRA